MPRDAEDVRTPQQEEAGALSVSTAHVPGQRIQRFVVLRSLGAGAMGMVLEAYDPELDRRLAIKLVHPERAGDERARERLLFEARSGAQLSHPHVVHVYEVGTVGDDVFIAFEYVEGMTLREWLSAEPRSVQAVLDVFLQAGRGLVAAHDAGVVHRDFKPENVLIGHDGRVRVADFGLAGVEASARDAGMLESGRVTSASRRCHWPSWSAPSAPARPSWR